MRRPGCVGKWEKDQVILSSRDLVIAAGAMGARVGGGFPKRSGPTDSPSAAYISKFTCLEC